MLKKALDTPNIVRDGRIRPYARIWISASCFHARKFQVAEGPSETRPLRSERVLLRAQVFLGRSPKIAVPMRTQVEPSSIATSKSCDMPMERTSIVTSG